MFIYPRASSTRTSTRVSFDSGLHVKRCQCLKFPLFNPLIATQDTLSLSRRLSYYEWNPSSTYTWLISTPTLVYILDHEVGPCKMAFFPGSDQWSGRFLGITGWDPSVCKSNRLHVDILWCSFIKLVYMLWIPLIWPVIILQSWTSTGFPSNSTGSYVTNCLLSPIIGSDLMVQHPWFGLWKIKIKNHFIKALGPFNRCEPKVDQEECPCSK